ncbi:MAG: saccharopine dehydrogenase family protein [Halobacteriales archaeon]
MDVLIYGSYGYTGRLVVEEALRRGFEPALGGRRQEEVESQADETGLESLAFESDEADDHVEGFDAVLNCAGPFSRTYADVVDACIEAGASYLDITGEVDVFRGIAARDAEARVADVSLLPGVGFDVVPSDCLAAYVAGELESPTHLSVGFDGSLTPSRGTARTAVEGLGRGCLVRRNGELVRRRIGSVTRDVDFGRGVRKAALFPLGDVVTAYRSTGVENIETYVGVGRGLALFSRVADGLGPVTRSRPVQSALRSFVDVAFDGPSEDERETEEAWLWAEAQGADGESFEARLRTPETYAFTARAAVEAAYRVDDVEPGFQTPATAYGEDFVVGFDGVERFDG